MVISLEQFLNNKIIFFTDVSKFDGTKLDHIWSVLQFFYDYNKAAEMPEAAFGTLSQAFKLDSIEGRTATSKQVLVAMIESIISSHVSFSII